MSHSHCKLLGLVAGLAACSASPSGNSTLNGNILGQPLTVQSTYSYTANSETSGSTAVVLGSYANGCALGPQHVTPKNSQALVFVFAQASSGGMQQVTAPGTFMVGKALQPGGVTVTFVGNDSQCVVTSADTGVSGTVTVSAVSGAEIDGSFDVVLSSSGPITGSFSAPDCSADDTQGPASGGGSANTCQ